MLCKRNPTLGPLHGCSSTVCEKSLKRAANAGFSFSRREIATREPGSRLPSMLTSSTTSCVSSVFSFRLRCCDASPFSQDYSGGLALQHALRVTTEDEGVPAKVMEVRTPETLMKTQDLETNCFAARPSDMCETSRTAAQSRTRPPCHATAI